MPNYSLDVNQVSVYGCNKRMFVPFLSIDSDFGENEEYWREDTLELGFESEAERVSNELFEKYKDRFHEEIYEDVLAEALEEAANYCTGGTQHVIGNTSYTGEYQITIICLDEASDDYVAVVSRMAY